MLSEEYQKWLDELKVGDEVCYDISSSYAKEKEYVVTKITSISEKTRQMTTLTGQKFKNGIAKQKGTTWNISYRLKPVTVEVREYIARQKAIKMLKAVNWENMYTESLTIIIRAVKEAKLIQRKQEE